LSHFLSLAPIQADSVGLLSQTFFAIPAMRAGEFCCSP
jgi:hypothetical protein